eukprot:scaffold8690_cov190-Amphora_coffeaeformis.AAC.18
MQTHNGGERVPRVSNRLTSTFVAPQSTPHIGGHPNPKSCHPVPKSVKAPTWVIERPPVSKVGNVVVVVVVIIIQKKV